MAFLTPDKTRVEHGLIIKEKIIPWGAVWPKDYKGYKKGDKYKADRLLSGGTGKVAEVTIHNTNDIEEAKGTNDAEQYARAVWPNANMGDVRVHYFIDETDCWQQLREDEVGWHAADGRGPGNETTLSIEIIMDGSGSAADLAAEDRGALLAAILLNRHGLGIDKLTTHQRWYSKKYCPAYILPHWDAFKAKVEKYLKQIQGVTETPAESTDALYRVQTGAFAKKPNADALAAELKAKGFATYIVQVGGLYKVQVGAYKVKGNATNMRNKIKAAGYDAFITVNANAAPAPAEKPAVAFSEGDKVKCNAGVKTFANGSKMASWVPTATLYVRGVEQGGKILLVSTEKTKKVYTGRVNASDVHKI